MGAEALSVRVCTDWADTLTVTSKEIRNTKRLLKGSRSVKSRNLVGQLL
jgi:hypothetical protein